jgi:predicted metal-dependent HD superfamily phosphohydrolase
MALSARWGGLQDLFEHVPLDDRAKAALFDEMSRPDRLYHGVGHLETLWRRHRLYSGRVGLGTPAVDTLVACAIAYHDSVFDFSKSDNEDRSADYWLEVSANSAVPDRDREWVAKTIRATKDHLGYAPNSKKSGVAARLRERARLWVLDLDLTPLGEPPDIFKANTRLLRNENKHLSDKEWESGLSAFRDRFLAAPQIYRFPELSEIYDASARRNLAHSLLR